MFLIAVSVIQVFYIYNFAKTVKKNATLKVNSEVSKNTAKVFFHVSWLDKPIEVIINDEIGLFNLLRNA